MGLVVALSAEARFLIGSGPWENRDGRIFRRIRLDDGTDLFCVRSGTGTRNALSAAEWLVSEGVSALAVLGISGGLNPKLKTGDLILGKTVLDKHGKVTRCVWKSNSSLVESAYRALKAKEMPAHMGAVITAEGAVLSAERKQSIYRETHALAVDMESSAVGQTATEAGLAFFLLRAICDTSDQNIPEELFLCLDPSGKTSLSPLIKSLFRRPSLITDLLRTRSRFVTALKSLRRGWRIQVDKHIPALLVSPDSQPIAD